MTLPLFLRFFFQKNFASFHFFQFCFNFFRYSQSNFLSPHSYNIFAINLSGISLCSSFILLLSLQLLSWHFSNLSLSPMNLLQLYTLSISPDIPICHTSFFCLLPSLLYILLFLLLLPKGPVISSAPGLAPYIS